jgi:hypothetical protein
MTEGQEGRSATRDGDHFWGYLGVGCLTFFAGAASGAMTSVLLAKIVGAARSCAPDPETGAPCNWFMYAVVGALLGAVLLPSVSLGRMRLGRARASKQTSERG